MLFLKNTFALFGAKLLTNAFLSLIIYPNLWSNVGRKRNRVLLG